MVHAMHRDTQRASKRRPIFTTAHVRCPDAGDTEHVALTRDLSSGGMFFFCNFTPSLGSSVNIRFMVAESAFIDYQGEVLRVEQKVPGAAAGIAVRFVQQSKSHP